MKQKLLRYFAARPLTLLGLSVGLFVIVPLASVGLILRDDGRGAHANAPPNGGQTAAEQGPFNQTSPSPHSTSPATDPRKILSRAWFDSLPEKRTDVIKLYFFGGGGIGIYEEGSSFRYSVDVFELERNANKLSMTFLQDKKTAAVTFTITECDELPPFDLCLDMPNSPRGPKRYYGFDDGDDSANHLPQWMSGMVEAVAKQAQ